MERLISGFADNIMLALRLDIISLLCTNHQKQLLRLSRKRGSNTEDLYDACRPYVSYRLLLQCVGATFATTKWRFVSR